MKRNLKLTISALAVLLVMALTVTVVSFSLADNENNGELVNGATVASATVDTYTNIDNIIQNSYTSGEGTDPVYRIVEIGSGNPSNLKTLVENGGFENYVINGNTTLDSITIKDAEGKESLTAAIMNAECIEYKFYKASEVSDDNEEALAAIAKADFIYVSNDESNKYSKTNDLGEELYNILHTYAVGDYKPLVIDNIGDPTGSGAPGGSGGSSSSTGMSDLATKVFDKSGMYYYTFKWDTTQSVQDFLAHVSPSAYLGINGNKKSANWTKITLKSNITDGVLAEGAETYNMSEVLIISDGTRTLSTELLADLGTEAANLVDLAGNDILATYKLEGTLLYESGYNARYSRPDYVRLNDVDIDDVADVDLDKYDLIIIEPDCNKDIDDATYKKLAAAMYGSVSIIYPASLSTNTGSGNSGPGTSAGNSSVIQETNYSELFYMVATSTGQVRYENVMITNKTEFDFIALSNSSATCKVIADLINASSYRGIGGPKNASNKFAVLEIQPCYPIDEALATANNNYYTIPADVMNNVTKEEIPEGTEYYAWELSKAKIASAFDISADQVVLDHMSTEQLASTKADVFGNYDLIYIGGNTSALRELLDMRAFYMNNGAITLSSINVNNITKLPIYTMYSHNGVGIKVDQGALGNQGQGSIIGTPTAQVVVNGQAKESFSLLNGNDITYNKLQQLKEYVEKGMPVVFSSKATAGYYAARDAKYNQNSIDPDSNMYKFMDYCGSASLENVLWGFDETAVEMTDNNGGDYGETLTGYVSVFEEEQATQLKSLCNLNGKRPKLTLTMFPASYNMYDKNSVVKNKKLSFEYKITGSTNYKVELFIDDNSNSVFADDEFAATGGNESLTYTVPDSYSGPLYWKLVVTDNLSKQETFMTGLTFIQASTTTKQKVRVLQIMPGTYQGPGNNSEYNKPYESYSKTVHGGEGPQAENSLYFCTICMEAYSRLEYNPAPDTSREEYQTIYDGHYKDNTNGMTRQGSNIYLGLHEHEFGIVKYDSTRTIEGTLGCDDWDWNLADEVADKYNFDLEIMMRSEYVELCEAIRDQSYNSNYIYALDKIEATKSTAADLKAQIVGANANPYATGTDEYNAYQSADTAGKYDMLVAEAKTKNQTTAAKAKLSYDAYSSLIMYSKADFDKAFADYPYKDELYMEIPTLSANELAASGLTKSALDAEIELRLALMDMVADLGGKDTTDGAEIYRLLTTRHYWDLYCCLSHKYAYNAFTTSTGKSINTCYSAYVKLNDIKINSYNDYKTYSRYAAGSMDWMMNTTTFTAKAGEVTSTVDGKTVTEDVMYTVDPGLDMVVIGASENFAGDDFILTKNGVVQKDNNGRALPAQRALDDLEYYLANNGSALMFHDTVTRFTDAGSAYLTDMIRPYAGMDRNHTEIDTKLMSNDAYYVPYVSSNKNKYFMTDLSIAGSTYTGADKYTNWRTEFNNTLNTWWTMSEYYLTDVAYTDAGAMPQTDGGVHDGAMPYKYAFQDWSKCAFWMMSDNTFKSIKTSGNHGTNKASKTNEGIVTMYPFTLADDLNITPTHAQAYALDLEDDDCTVWYSMGGTTGHKNGGSIFAASPNDGMDSYFIYTYGNFNYCGAGHCNVTGVWKDNNDERRLYINIICNSVKKSVAQPDILVYDYQTTENKIFKKSGDMYLTKVDSVDSYPEFSFIANLDKGAQISTVRIYYDLDYLDKVDDKYTADKNHILIANWTRDQVEESKRKDVFRYDSTIGALLDDDGKEIPETYVDEDGNTISTRASLLKLQSKYFDPYNGQYTYIVIEVTDTKGNVSYKRIKIQLKDKLFNLT